MAATTHLVNLDALIRRENFEGSSDNVSQHSSQAGQIKLMELEDNYLHLLKKPDFQRTTHNWSPSMIMDFIRSFLDGDLIPPVIMWRNPRFGEFFIIDGAHRLSALVAWVHDDYGDGHLSESFWKTSISRAQIKQANATRIIINEEIGSYKYLKDVQQRKVPPRNEQMLLRANNTLGFAMNVQWVPGTSENAARSFFRINSSAVLIDKTELEIIKARLKPNAIATRALVGAGMGHKYWGGFSAEIGVQIESLAKEVWDALFTPLFELPARTTDLPIAGEGYSAVAFKMIFDFVNQVNKLTPPMWQEEEKKQQKRKSKVTADPEASTKLKDDDDGMATVQCLKNVRRAALLISGNHSGSLGLHPLVYFYSHTCRFHPTAFLATVKFVMDLKEKKRFYSFTKCRAAFEEYLVKHAAFVSELGHQYGGGSKPLTALFTMYYGIFNAIKAGVIEHEEITKALIREPKLAALQKVVDKPPKPKKRGKKFSTDDKSEVFINQAIDNPIRCVECNSRIHIRGFNIDHDQRIEDGGTGDPRNGGLTHYYCNGGFKEQRLSIERKKAAGTVSGVDEEDPPSKDEE